MARKRNKSYYKPQKYDPVVQGEKIERLDSNIQKLKATIDSVNQNHARHIEHLANFVAHDIKNGIQSIDGIIYNANLCETTKKELKTALGSLRSTLDNFSKITKDNADDPYTATELLNAIELLTRSSVASFGASIEIEYDRDSLKYINHSFQALLQILHNLILNSLTSIQAENTKIIKLQLSYINENCVIEISDSGKPIEMTEVCKIWEYKYSTTGGSGIGLFHVKYLTEQMQGKCDCVILDSNLFTKKFIINFPLKFIDNE